MAGRPARTGARRCRRTPSTSRATSPARPRCSSGSDRARRAGHHGPTRSAALFVAGLVLLAAARLMRRNVDVLMDRAPAEAEAAALAGDRRRRAAGRAARLRMRQAAGRQFADVVIGVPPGRRRRPGPRRGRRGRGGGAARRCRRATSSSTSSRRGDEAALRERAHAAALRVPRVREIHNLSVLARRRPRTEVSLHLKLPGDLPLDEAHEVASEVERAIVESAARGRLRADAPRAARRSRARRRLGDEAAADRALIERIVRETTGAPPRELRFLQTDDGLRRATSRSGSTRTRRSPRRTRGRARSRSASGASGPRSPMSSSTPSREALHVQLRSSTSSAAGRAGSRATA